MRLYTRPAHQKPSGRNAAQESVRKHITDEEWDRWVESMWEIATSATRPEWVECPRCNRKTEMARVDTVARINAGKELQAMGYGKPKDDDATQRGFVLNRVIVVPEGAQNAAA